jgi:hypothetical protein
MINTSTWYSDNLQQSDHHQSCWRRCRHRRNKIVLLPTATNGGGGGLCDRATIFKTFLNLAGYLCATVHVLPTDQVLGSQHRHGHVQSLHDVPWSDLMDMRLLPGNTSDAFQEYNENASTLFPDNETNTWQRVSAHARLEGHMKGITQSFEQIEILSWKQDKVEMSEKTLTNNHTSDYFIWTIDAPFYMWADAFALYLQSRISKTAIRESDSNNTSSRTGDDNEHVAKTIMLPTIDPQRFVGCTYSSLYPPSHMQVIADRVWDALQNEQDVVQHKQRNQSYSSQFSAGNMHMTVGYLHIRRNDATKYCNTSLERMKRFLECSLKKMATSGNKVVLLFSSDEESSEYRQGIRKIVMDNGYGPFFDLDDMVRRAVQEDIEQRGFPKSRANNYYIFHTVWTIARQHSAFQLSQRRDQSCPRCVEVTLDNLPQESLELEGQRKGIRWTKKTRYLQEYFQGSKTIGSHER